MKTITILITLLMLGAVFAASTTITPETITDTIYGGETKNYELTIYNNFNHTATMHIDYNITNQSGDYNGFTTNLSENNTNLTMFQNKKITLTIKTANNLKPETYTINFLATLTSEYNENSSGSGGGHSYYISPGVKPPADQNKIDNNKPVIVDQNKPIVPDNNKPTNNNNNNNTSTIDNNTNTNTTNNQTPKDDSGFWFWATFTTITGIILIGGLYWFFIRKP